MTDTRRHYAMNLERRLRPLAATAVAAAGGGTDSHGAPVPGLDSRLRAVRDDLAGIQRWIEETEPLSAENRRGKR